MTKLITVLAILLSSSLMAAGDGHSGGSPLDLKWAFVNTVLLFGFLGWKMKGPVTEMFDTKSKDVAELYQFAGEKEKEAEARLSSLKTKMSNLESEKEKIIKEVEEETKSFISKSESDLEAYLQRVERDTEAKLSTEKATLEKNLNSRLVDEVIIAAKNKLKSDSSLASKASANILSQVK